MNLRHQWAAELSRLDVTARVLDAHGRDDTASRVTAAVVLAACAGVVAWVVSLGG